MSTDSARIRELADAPAGQRCWSSCPASSSRGTAATARPTSTTCVFSGDAGDTEASRPSLRSGIFNLFDRKASDIDYFYTSRLKGEPAQGVNDIHLHPVEPRTLRVTLIANF